MGKHNKYNKRETKEYYGYNDMNNILKYSDENPYIAVELLEKYLEEYDLDVSGYHAYASLLTTIGDFEKSKKIRDYVNNVLLSSKKYERVDGGDKKKRYIICRNFLDLRYNLYTNNLEKALELTEQFLLEPDSIETDAARLKLIKFFCEQRLYGESSLIRDNYMGCQISNYSDEAFLEHIKRHLTDSDVEDKSGAIFNEGFPIEKIFEEIKKNVKKENIIYKGFLERILYFRYDNCGRCEGQVCDYFKVVVLDDLTSFITMFPCPYGKDLPHVDLNYLQEDVMTRTKRLSQKDKFLKKYGNMV